MLEPVIGGPAEARDAVGRESLEECALMAAELSAAVALGCDEADGPTGRGSEEIRPCSVRRGPSGACELCLELAREFASGWRGEIVEVDRGCACVGLGRRWCKRLVVVFGAGDGEGHIDRSRLAVVADREECG